MVRADLLGQLLTRDEAAGLEVLRELRDEASAFLAEMRRVLADRAPAELEDRDLAYGLDILARRMVAASGERVGVSVDVEDAVGALGWTVQVAAFWIVKEALTNVVKHADARTCVVRVWVDGGLRLSVVDDGRGGVTSRGHGSMAGSRGDRPAGAGRDQPAEIERDRSASAGPDRTAGVGRDRPAGVGLSSMRERAAELGGSCHIADTGCGVTVTAHLPEGLDSHDRAA